jgi:hypothetical protein
MAALPGYHDCHTLPYRMDQDFRKQPGTNTGKAETDRGVTMEVNEPQEKPKLTVAPPVKAQEGRRHHEPQEKSRLIVVSPIKTNTVAPSTQTDREGGHDAMGISGNTQLGWIHEQTSPPAHHHTRDETMDVHRDNSLFGDAINESHGQGFTDTSGSFLGADDMGGGQHIPFPQPIMGNDHDSLPRHTFGETDDASHASIGCAVTQRV